jgi:predicted nucleotidyltransferase
MITPSQLEGYRTGWQKRKKIQEENLTNRYNTAMAKASLAISAIKQKYKCKAFLFGSLLHKEEFLEHSDIDIAVAGLAPEINFWQLYSEVMDILHPFDFDLVELERIDPEVREYIVREGMEL